VLFLSQSGTNRGWSTVPQVRFLLSLLPDPRHLP